MKWNEPFSAKESIIILACFTTAFLVLCVWAISKNLPVHSACCGMCAGLLLVRTIDFINEFKDEKTKENIY